MKTISGLRKKINSRYVSLNINKGDFKGLNESAKLSKLLNLIEKDSEIKILNDLSPKRMRFKVINPGENCVSLEIESDGLYAYEWDRTLPENKVHITPNYLASEKIGAQELRAYIVDFFAD